MVEAVVLAVDHMREPGNFEIIVNRPHEGNGLLDCSVLGRLRSSGGGPLDKELLDGLNRGRDRGLRLGDVISFSEVAGDAATNELSDQVNAENIAVCRRSVAVEDLEIDFLPVIAGGFEEAFLNITAHRARTRGRRDVIAYVPEIIDGNGVNQGDCPSAKIVMCTRVAFRGPARAVLTDFEGHTICMNAKSVFDQRRSDGVENVLALVTLAPPLMNDDMTWDFPRKYLMLAGIVRPV